MKSQISRWAAMGAVCALSSIGCEGALSAGRDAGRGRDAGLVDAGRPSLSVDGGAGFRVDAGGLQDAGLPGSDARAPQPIGDDLTAEEADLLRALNDERATRGLSPVTVDPALLCAARAHALDVGASGDCGHVGADGSWPWDRAMRCGFPQENWTVNEIAAGPGFDDGADAVWGWSHSDGHYAALMHPEARTVGVAVHRTCFIALFDCCVAGSE